MTFIHCPTAGVPARSLTNVSSVTWTGMPEICQVPTYPSSGIASISPRNMALSGTSGVVVSAKPLMGRRIPTRATTTRTATYFQATAFISHLLTR